MFADGERSWFELTATIQHARNEIALRQQKTFQAKVHGEIFALLRVVFFSFCLFACVRQVARLLLS